MGVAMVYGEIQSDGSIETMIGSFCKRKMKQMTCKSVHDIVTGIRAALGRWAKGNIEPMLLYG
jgi:hypothetical protein